MKHSKFFKIVLSLMITLAFSNLVYTQVECTNLTEPENGSTGVIISTDLTWAASNGATGYILRVGLTSGGGEIMDDVDVGNVTTYDPGDFPCGSTIFVTITPYDGINTPPLCDEESFETEYVIPEAGNDQTICEGESAQLNASGGTTYSWEPPESLDDPNIPNPIASPMETTVYTVTVTNESGCFDADYVTVYVNPNPVANASATDESCYQCNDGTATVDPSGGTPPYWYQWSTGETTQSIENLAPDDYTVTVGDMNDCYSVETVTVNPYVCPDLIIEDYYLNPCYNSCDGVIKITNVINGTPPFTYIWSTGADGNNIAYLCPGNYSVTVTDSYYCSVEKNYTLTELSQIFPNATATDETCNGCNDGTATSDPSGSLPPYTFEWSTGDTTQTILNLAPGDYYVTVYDTTLCSSSDTVTVNQFICPQLTIIDSVKNTCYGVCNGSITILDITNGVPPFTYSWSTGATTAGINDLCAGNYSVTVTDSKYCTVSKNYTISEFAQIIPNATATDETCNNCNDGTATANPSGGTPPYYYNWSTGEQTQSIAGLPPGSYTVTVGDVNNCEQTQTVTVAEFICPQLTIIDSVENTCYGVCDGSISIIDVTNGIAPFTYSWSTGATTAGINNLCAGNYSVTVTDSKYCTVSKNYTISEFAQIIPNATATDETCNNCNDGTATANPSGGTPPYSYNWSTGEQTQSISGLSPGNYTVTVGDVNECEQTQTVTVAEFICPALTVVEDQSNSCYGECTGYISISDITNGVAPFTYSWSTGATTAGIYNLCAGNYSVTVTDSKYCTVSKNYTISEFTQIIPNATATDETCNNCDDGTATANPSGGTPPYYYNWSTGGQTQSISGLSPGNYTVTVGDVNECEQTQTVTVAEFICPALTVVEDQSNSCYGECTGYISISDITNGVAPFTYSWSTGATTAGIYNLCTGNYSVTVTDSKYCTVSKNYTISEFTQIIPNASATNETCNNCNDGTATANPTGGTPPYYYIWSTGQQTQSISGLSPGNYTVTVGDVNECEQTQTVSVAQFGCPEMIIEDQIVNVLCYGNCNGSISITGVTNTQGTLSYNWSNDSTNSSITNLCPGNYSVTVTDISLNCSTNKLYTITQPSKLSVATVKIDESCNECNNGTATATASGGIPPYNYNWSNGSTSQTISNLTPGTYIITVEDANQCNALDTVVIDQYGCPDMVIQDSIEEISCYGTCDGSISINGISNTIGTLLYQWSNNNSNSSISNLCPGNYSVTVTDVSNNCTVSKSYTLIQPDDIIITIDNKTNPTSNSKGKIDISTNNDGTYTFTWTGPNGYNANTEDIDSLEEGCYSLIVANDSDCSKDTTICLEKETATIDLNNKFGVSLYPNPASNQVIVDISKTGFTNTEISLFNISGDRYNFYKSENSKLVILDVSKLKQGLYFVEIKFKTGIVYNKLVISK